MARVKITSPSSTDGPMTPTPPTTTTETTSRAAPGPKPLTPGPPGLLAEAQPAPATTHPVTDIAEGSLSPTNPTSTVKATHPSSTDGPMAPTPPTTTTETTSRAAPGPEPLTSGPPGLPAEHPAPVPGPPEIRGDIAEESFSRAKADLRELVEAVQAQIDQVPDEHSECMDVARLRATLNAPALLQSIDELRLPNIAFIGRTGSGKTTLLVALLTIGMEKDMADAVRELLPSGDTVNPVTSMRITLKFSETPVVKISFSGVEKWNERVTLALDSLDAPTEGAASAKELLLTAYPSRFPTVESITVEAIKELRRAREIEEDPEIKTLLELPSHEEELCFPCSVDGLYDMGAALRGLSQSCASRLEEEEAGGERAPVDPRQALADHITVGIPSPFLRGGLQLTEVPGFGDSNPHRLEMSTAGLRESSNVVMAMSQEDRFSEEISAIMSRIRGRIRAQELSSGFCLALTKCDKRGISKRPRKRQRLTSDVSEEELASQVKQETDRKLEAKMANIWEFFQGAADATGTTSGAGAGAGTGAGTDTGTGAGAAAGSGADARPTSSAARATFPVSVEEFNNASSTESQSIPEAGGLIPLASHLRGQLTASRRKLKDVRQLVFTSIRSVTQAITQFSSRTRTIADQANQGLRQWLQETGMPFLEKDTEPLTASLGLSSDDIPSFVEQTVSDLGCPSAAVLRGAMNHEQLETRAAMFQQDHRLQEPIRSLQQAVDIWMKRSLKARSDSLFTTLFNSLKQQGFQAREDQTRLTKSRIEEKRRRLLVEVETKRVHLMRLLSRSIRQAWNVVPRPEPMTAAYVQAKRRWGEGRGYTTDVARMCKIGSQGRLQERVAASLGELNHVRRLTTEIRECVERGFAQMVAMACTAAASEAPVSEASRQCLTALEDLLTAGRARVSEAVDEFATQLDDGERSLPAPLAPPMFRMLLEEEDDEEE